MATVELDSFITKLKHLWHNGYKANFQVDISDGKAAVTLTADLGYIEPPPISPKNRGPACSRRQKRRRQEMEKNKPIKSEVVCEETAEQADAEVNNVDAAQVVDVSIKEDLTLKDATEKVVHESNVILDEHTEEVDKFELERDMLVEEVLIYAVKVSSEDVSDVEEKLE